MRLQKQRSREVKGREYFRWAIVIPPRDIEELGWQEGEELESEAKRDRLILKKRADG